MAILNCTGEPVNIFLLNQVTFSNGRYNLTNIANVPNKTIAPSALSLKVKLEILAGTGSANNASVEGIAIQQHKMTLTNPASIIGSNITNDTYICDVFYKKTYDLLNKGHTVKLVTVGIPVYNNTILNQIVGYINFAS